MKTKYTEIKLCFAVTDEVALRQLAESYMKKWGMGAIEPYEELRKHGDEALGLAVMEVLLHSNPDIPPYLDMGIELIDSNYEDWESE
jgi:dsRNA-specific ribonuclease